jgi:hypothetical protein
MIVLLSFQYLGNELELFYPHKFVSISFFINMMACHPQI